MSDTPPFPPPGRRVCPNCEGDGFVCEDCGWGWTMCDCETPAGQDREDSMTLICERCDEDCTIPE